MDGDTERSWIMCLLLTQKPAPTLYSPFFPLDLALQPPILSLTGASRSKRSFESGVWMKRRLTGAPAAAETLAPSDSSGLCPVLPEVGLLLQATVS